MTAGRGQLIVWEIRSLWLVYTAVFLAGPGTADPIPRGGARSSVSGYSYSWKHDTFLIKSKHESPSPVAQLHFQISSCSFCEPGGSSDAGRPSQLLVERLLLGLRMLVMVWAEDTGRLFLRW